MTLADYTHSRSTHALLTSLAKVVCPPQAISMGLTGDIVAHVELSMRATPPLLRTALLAGLTGYDLAAMAVPSHLGKRASALSKDKAARYFASWYHAKLLPQHEFAKGVKGLLCLGCYEQPAMMAAIGYTPQEWIDKKVKQRLTTFSDAIAKRKIEILADDPLPNVQKKERVSP